MLPFRDGEPPPVPMTTLIAPLSRAEQVVGVIRREHDWSASRGVPAHITLFGPFVSPGEVTTDLLDQLHWLFADQAPVRVSLSHLDRLGGAACLLADATQPFAALAARVGQLRPGLQQRVRRYHVTVARECDDALFSLVAAELKPHLPLQDCVTVAELLERGCDGTVRSLGEFGFRSGAGTRSIPCRLLVPRDPG